MYIILFISVAAIKVLDNKLVKLSILSGMAIEHYVIHSIYYKHITLSYYLHLFVVIDLLSPF